MPENLPGGAGVIRSWTAPARAARAFLTPRRLVVPPALPEPPGGQVIPVPGFAPHLNVRGWGPAAAPAVLLVHGWERSLYDMVPLVPLLLAQGLRVLAVDAPAHGRSGGDTASLIDIARAISAVVATVGGVAAAVGHSLGAAALVLSMAEGMDPGRVVLLAPAPAPLPYALDCARQHGLDADQTMEMLALLDQAFGCPVAALSTAVAAEGLRQPALLIHALDDRVTPVADSLHLAACWPGARLHLVEGLGHNRLLRDPGVLQQVAAFVIGAA
ncbi:alpha/beta fold hydrolase [Oleisolibacter albus]|uniref:alpha/beta fold hydrolase n=1 Tax=Oleisolibacter albus TaxID=2171757 RepID=UPI0013900161|nr:alpha/beta fold hydrolase [Oleisolibacter albus]